MLISTWKSLLTDTGSVKKLLSIVSSAIFSLAKLASPDRDNFKTMFEFTLFDVTANDIKSYNDEFWICYNCDYFIIVFNITIFYLRIIYGIEVG